MHIHKPFFILRALLS